MKISEGFLDELFALQPRRPFTDRLFLVEREENVWVVEIHRVAEHNGKTCIVMDNLNNLSNTCASGRKVCASILLRGKGGENSIYEFH